MRVIAVLLLVVAVAVAESSPVGACWLPPVVGEVVDPFREPACRWCPGNRGLEYRVGGRTPVRALAAGEVTYAGSVAGVVYVVVRHADGRRVTYGRLAERSVDRGDRVVARQRIGVASGTFHLGLRVDGRYVDPAPHLGRLLGRPRLVPVDGSAPRPAAPPRIRCGTASVRR